MYWLWRDRLRRKLRSSSVLSAKPACRVMLLEAAREHTSDPSLDPSMILFQSIVQVDIRPVTDVAAQRGTDRPRVGVVPISGCPVRHKASNRPCRAEAPFRRPHVTGRTQHRVNEVSVAIDRPIQVAPLTMDLQVGLIIGVPALARPGRGRDAACATPRPSQATASPPTAECTHD